MAKEGDMRAIEYVLDRVGGKPLQAVEVETEFSFTSGRGIGNRSRMRDDSLYPRLPVVCQLRDTVSRLPQLRITDPVIALSDACGYATSEGQNY